MTDAGQNIAATAVGPRELYDVYARKYDFRFDESGATAVVNGERKPLADVLNHIALVDHPTLADQRTVKGLKQATEQKQRAQYPAYRSQFSDITQKVEYINKFGIEAWEQLPVRPPRTAEIRTFEDYVKLDQATKLKYSLVRMVVRLCS